MKRWTLLSNHGHVLVCLSRGPEARLRDVAIDVGITERAVQKIVRDLQDAGMISVTKHGRRNRYRIHPKVSMRHALEADCTVKDLLKIVKKKSLPSSSAGTAELKKDGQPASPAAEPVKVQADKPRQEKSKPDKPEPDGKTETDRIQRQQGTLF